jgi:hypothetical protein
MGEIIQFILVLAILLHYPGVALIVKFSHDFLEIATLQGDYEQDKISLPFPIVASVNLCKLFANEEINAQGR